MLTEGSLYCSLNPGSPVSPPGGRTGAVAEGRAVMPKVDITEGVKIAERAAGEVAADATEAAALADTPELAGNVIVVKAVRVPLPLPLPAPPP